MPDAEFDRLLAEAERQPFSGWDFSFIAERMQQAEPSWDYTSIVRIRLQEVDAVLDMGTGGGEFLASLAPLPTRTVATEAYPPNVAIARARLAPLGVEVVAVEGAPDNVHIAPGKGIGSLPFPDGAFPLVINRHESYYPAEVYRILKPGGSFLTQQVGGRHDEAVNHLLGVLPGYNRKWNLEFASRQLEEAGFRIVEVREEFPATGYTDVGALAYYLRAVPWQVPGFTIECYRDRLAALHDRIAAQGALEVRGHFLYVEVSKP